MNMSFLLAGSASTNPVLFTFAIGLILAWRVFRSRAGERIGERNDDGLYDVKASSKDARNLFAFSILYLTLLFATLLAEHLLDLPAVGAFQ